MQRARSAQRMHAGLLCRSDGTLQQTIAPDVNRPLPAPGATIPNTGLPASLREAASLAACLAVWLPSGVSVLRRHSTPSSTVSVWQALLAEAALAVAPLLADARWGLAAAAASVAGGASLAAEAPAAAQHNHPSTHEQRAPFSHGWLAIAQASPVCSMATQSLALTLCTSRHPHTSLHTTRPAAPCTATHLRGPETA